MKTTAIDYLLTIKELARLPHSIENPKEGVPSNSEIRRWLQNKAVRINGVTPDIYDEIEFPVTDLVFFGNSKKKCTMMASDNAV